jgi:hypothetical protein
MMNASLFLLLVILTSGCLSSESDSVDTFLGLDRTTGNGSEVGNAAITFSPSSESFGTEYVGDTSDSSVFTLVLP